MKRKKIIKLMEEDIKEYKSYSKMYENKKFQRGWNEATKYWINILRGTK